VSSKRKINDRKKSKVLHQVRGRKRIKETTSLEKVGGKGLGIEKGPAEGRVVMNEKSEKPGATSGLRKKGTIQILRS